MSKKIREYDKAFKLSAVKLVVESGNLKPEDQLDRELKKRVRDLEEENAILKKAMRIFVK